VHATWRTSSSPESRSSVDAIASRRSSGKRSTRTAGVRKTMPSTRGRCACSS
jgi:hypothetical protein